MDARVVMSRHRVPIMAGPMEPLAVQTVQLFGTF